MEVAYTIGGGGLHLKKYRTDDGAAAFTAGQPVCGLEATAAMQGVAHVTTTTAIALMGITIDATASSTAAQITDNAENATYVTVCINPDAVFRAKLNEGATEDTALVIATQTAVSAAGTDVSSDISVPDNSTVWGYKGANAGIDRITSAADTVVLAFPKDIAAGDEWLFTEHVVGWTEASPQLSTAFTQIDSNVAGTTTKNFVFLEFELKDITDDGRNNSYGLMVGYDHAFSGSQLA